MVGNATLLCILYFVVAISVEAVRRIWTFRWSERMSLALESLAARTFELLGLMAPLRRAYVYGQLSEFWARVLFGLTTVVVIFALAAVVGFGMWLLRLAYERKMSGP